MASLYIYMQPPGSHEVVTLGRVTVEDVLPTTEGAAPSRLAMGIGRFGHEISRRNLLSQVEHYGLSEAEAGFIMDEVIDRENELLAHYRQHLQKAEMEVAIAAMGGAKLR